MSRKTTRFVIIGGACLLAAILVVVSAVLRSGDLDAADKWASVMGVYLNIAALVVAVAGLLLGLRFGRNRATTAKTRQVITGEGKAVVDAQRSQHVSGATADQVIAGSERSSVKAADAQIVRGAEDETGADG